jgi:glutaredoxin
MNDKETGMSRTVKKSRLFFIAALSLVLLGTLFVRPTEVLAQFAGTPEASLENAPFLLTEGHESPAPTVIYMFWGDGCPHCAEAETYLVPLDESSDQIELRMFEVWNDKDNQKLFKKMAAAYGFEPRAVPTIFIGNQHWVGYSDQIRGEIQAALDACAVTGCIDAGAGIVPEATVVEQVPAAPNPQNETGGGGSQQVVLPLIGAVDLSSQSLLVSTLLISFVDGFNPCSIWVLSMLLALTLHTGSRKKVVIIGLIFLTVTAAIYALFIAGLFTMFTVVSFVGWIQVVVALVALFFALVNIKDYFWYKEGLSFTIADDKKPGIFQRMRRLMDASQSFWGLVGGTVVLAAGVSLVEFSCTAGFPVLWTNLLVSQNVAAVAFILLLLVYVVIYQLDELGIFFVAVFTMRSSKVEEKHGRILKLIGGTLMLSLAGVMLINPSLMNNLSSSLVVFGIAFGATLLVLLLHRVVLPKMGIMIGTEFNSKGKHKKRH